MHVRELVSAYRVDHTSQLLLSSKEWSTQAYEQTLLEYLLGWSKRSPTNGLTLYHSLYWPIIPCGVPRLNLRPAIPRDQIGNSS